MSKRHEAKYKIDRRLGENIWGRAKSPVNKRAYAPGQHGQEKKGNPSDYGLQLLAKQKLRLYYGNISERQFQGIYKEAIRLSGDSGENLIGLLERRLDACVYRSKFSPTVFSARQLVNHGHVLVNGHRVDISSYRLSVGDQVEIKQSSKEMALIMEALASSERSVPDYIEWDASRVAIKFLRVPVLSDVPYPTLMQPSLVIEYYSR